MKIVIAKPPNYDQIVKVFGKKATDTAVFTYGDTVYNPHAGGLPYHLIAHEQVHIDQQTAFGAETWWDKYLTDPAFRLAQESEAYREQYRSLGNASRGERRKILQRLVADLSGSLYGKMISKAEAKQIITDDNEA